MKALTQAVLFITIIRLSISQSTSGGDFLHNRGPVPSVFQVGTRYPDRNETEECRPIRLRVVRNSRLYRTQLVTNTNPQIIFHSADARVMTARVQARLNALAASYYQHYQARITVLRSWSEFSVNDTSIGDPNSLHYEGNVVSAGEYHITRPELHQLCNIWLVHHPIYLVACWGGN